MVAEATPGSFDTPLLPAVARAAQDDRTRQFQSVVFDSVVNVQLIWLFDGQETAYRGYARMSADHYYYFKMIIIISR